MDRYLVNDGQQLVAPTAAEIIAEIKELHSSANYTTLKKIEQSHLDLDYGVVFSKNLANRLMAYFEENLHYLTPAESSVKAYGKWRVIPRKQTAYGEPGASYKFSGTTVDAKRWDPVMEAIKNYLNDRFGQQFNFVLVNRYANGSDHIGEHRDDEKELDPTAPIASVSLGEQRSFLLRHWSRRKRRYSTTTANDAQLDNVRLDLENGSLLLMNPPTNTHWYHSLPARKSAVGCRINLTFRRITAVTLPAE